MNTMILASMPSFGLLLINCSCTVETVLLVKKATFLYSQSLSEFIKYLNSIFIQRNCIAYKK